jgi:hypothetical protein
LLAERVDQRLDESGRDTPGLGRAGRVDEAFVRAVDVVREIDAAHARLPQVRDDRRDGSLGIGHAFVGPKLAHILGGFPVGAGEPRLTDADLDQLAPATDETVRVERPGREAEPDAHPFFEQIRVGIWLHDAEIVADSAERGDGRIGGRVVATEDDGGDVGGETEHQIPGAFGDRERGDGEGVAVGW